MKKQVDLNFEKPSYQERSDNTCKIKDFFAMDGKISTNH
jgi:hypothetical protein